MGQCIAIHNRLEMAVVEGVVHLLPELRFGLGIVSVADSVEQKLLEARLFEDLAQDVEQTAFLQVFKPEDAARRDVLRLYELARQTPHGFESYAKRLAKRYSSCPQILEDVLEGLFHIAVADGYLTHEEETYLETVSRLFGLKSTTYRSIRSGYVPADTEDPYVILGIEPHASDEEVRKARRLRLSDVHPDRIRARGLPPDFETLYTQKAARINLAFDGIMKERMADSTTM